LLILNHNQQYEKEVHIYIYIYIYKKIVADKFDEDN